MANHLRERRSLSQRKEVFNIKLIYVAGKYTGKSDWETYLNIHKAKVAAKRLWDEGWAVICPHANTAFFSGEEDHEVDRLKWIEGDLEMLWRCDAIYMLRDFRKSRGAMEEYRQAQLRGLEILLE